MVGNFQSDFYFAGRPVYFLKYILQGLPSIFLSDEIFIYPLNGTFWPGNIFSILHHAFQNLFFPAQSVA